MSPAQVIGAMFKHYAEAKTGEGTITYTFAAGGQSMKAITKVAFERPSKLLIHTAVQGGSRKQWVVTSDGKLMTYDAPPTGLKSGGDRIMDNVVMLDGKSMPVGRILAIARPGMGDASAPLDIITADNINLAYLRGQWAELKEVKESESARTFGGAWRTEDAVEFKGSDIRGGGTSSVQITKTAQSWNIQGTWSITVDKSFNITRYATRQLITAPSGESVEVESFWDVDVKLGGSVDSSLFKPRR